MIGPLLLYTVARATASTRVARIRVGSGLAAGGILAALIGLLLWWSGDGTLVDGIRRLVGLTFSPNQAALLFERSFFVCLGLALANRSNVRWIWLAGAGIIALDLLFTGSRGALLLGIPAGLGLFLIQQAPLRRWLKRTIWLIGTGAIAMLAGGVLFLGERLLNSATMIQRLHIWQGALDLWRAFPWLGTGPGGFFWNYPAFMTTAAANEPNLLHPHNIWLELATGWGLLGLLWLLTFGYWLVRRATSPAIRLSGIEVGLLAGLVAGISHGHVDTFGLLPELAAWNWLAIGLLSAESRVE